MVWYNVGTGLKRRTGYCSIGTRSIAQGIEQISGRAWSTRNITEVNESAHRGENE